MSSPAIAFENLDMLETADAIAVDRILHDDRILSELERQFEPATVYSAVETADAQCFASIESALPSAVQANKAALSQLKSHEVAIKSVVIDQGVMEHTMPGDETAVRTELEIPHAEKRQYTAKESELIFTALRKAATTKGYRREATDILARNAPTRFERLRHRVALSVGKIIA